MHFTKSMHECHYSASEFDNFSAFASNILVLSERIETLFLVKCSPQVQTTDVI